MASKQSGWTPGFRHARFQPGRIANKRTLAYLAIEQFTFRIVASEGPEEGMPEGWGTDFYVAIGNGRTYVQFDPTHMTADDIEELRDFFDLVIGLAKPVTERRDELAEQGRQQGDDSYSRLYRRFSPMVMRQAQIREYDQGVYDRCPRLLGRREPDGDRPGEPRSGGPPMAESDAPEDVGAANDGPEGDES